MQRKLGEQTQEAQEKLKNLSLSGWEEAGDDRGYEDPEEKKKQEKMEHKQREKLKQERAERLQCSKQN